MPKQTSTQMKAGEDFVGLSNALAFKLFAAADAPGENACISPLSVTMALAIVANGAQGQTRDAVLKTVGETGGIKALNEGAQNLMVVLHSMDNCPITISNAVWMIGPNAISPSKTFAAALGDNFDAKIDKTPDAGSAGVDAINKWTSSVTSGMIDHAIDNLDPEAHFVVADAAAFQSRWQVQFDPSKTASGEFKRSDGRTSTTNYMSVVNKDFLSNQSDDATYVELLYKPTDFAMLFIIPSKGSPEEFLKKQTSKSWNALVSNLYADEVHVKIPKMTFRKQYDLKESFERLGLRTLFKQADMSGISPSMSSDFLSRIDHATFLEVDEQGTRAAATTDPNADAAISDFEADHPFAFAIVHNPTGAILFLGVCNDPSQN